MGVYGGLRRKHLHVGARMDLGGLVTRPRRINTERVSVFASTDTYEERQKRQADGLREFTNEDGRLFISDATLSNPYGNLSQVGHAIQGSRSSGPVMIRNNRYDTLPDWMGKLQSLNADPLTRQRLVDLQYEEDARRENIEGAGTKKKVTAKRLANPITQGKRELEPYSSQYPYKRQMKVDRTAMRDESTIPHSSLHSQQLSQSVEYRGTPPVALRKGRGSESERTVPVMPVMPIRGAVGGMVQKIQSTFGTIADFLFPLDGYQQSRADSRQHYLSHAQRTSFAQEAFVTPYSIPRTVPQHSLSSAAFQSIQSISNPQQPHRAHSEVAQMQPITVQTGTSTHATTDTVDSITRHNSVPLNVKPLTEGHSKVAGTLDTTEWVASRHAQTPYAKPLTEGYSKVADVLDVSGWVASRHGQAESSSLHTPPTRSILNLVSRDGESARNDIGPQVKGAIPVSLTVNSVPYLPSSNHRQSQSTTQGATKNVSVGSEIQGLPAMSTRAEQSTQKVPETRAQAATASAVWPELLHLERKHQDTQRELWPRGETSIHSTQKHRTVPLTNENWIPGKEIFNTAAHSTFTVDTDTHPSSMPPPVRVRNQQRASSIGISQPMEQMDAALYNEREGGVGGTSGHVNPRARGQWQERVAPFVTHLSGLTPATFRERSLFGGPR